MENIVYVAYVIFLAFIINFIFKMRISEAACMISSVLLSATYYAPVCFLILFSFGMSAFGGGSSNKFILFTDYIFPFFIMTYVLFINLRKLSRYYYILGLLLSHLIPIAFLLIMALKKPGGGMRYADDCLLIIITVLTVLFFIKPDDSRKKRIEAHS